MKTGMQTIMALLLMLAVNKSSAGTWENYSNFSQTTDVLVKGNEMWITAKGGILKIDQLTGKRIFIRKGELGLMSSSVEKILTNALTGDTWIGTYDNGLAKWDGTKFIPYPFPQTMLLSNMTSDRNGRLWVESNMGLFVFNPNSGAFTKINDAPVNTWTYNAWGFDFLNKTKVAVFNGTTNLILDALSGAVVDSFQNPIDTSVHQQGEIGLLSVFLGCSPLVLSVFTLDSNTLLIQSGNSLVIHEKNGILRLGTMGLQNGEMAMNIERNEAGTLVLFTDQNRLYTWNGQQWMLLTAVNNQAWAKQLTFIHNGKYYFNTVSNTDILEQTTSGYTLIDVKRYIFPTNSIRAIAQEPGGSVVCASENQILRYDVPTNSWASYLSVPSKYNMLSAIKFFDFKTYMIDYGNMMLIYDGIVFDTVPKLVGGHSNDVYDYDVAPDGTIWIVNGDGLLKYNGTITTKVLGNITAISIKYDQSLGSLWIGTTSGILLYDLDFGTYEQFNHTSHPQMQGAESIQTIAMDNNNRVWFGANRGRFYNYDGLTLTALSIPNSQSNDFITDFDFSGDTVYMNLKDGNGGVYRYVNGTFQFFHPTTVSQMFSSQNDDILIDGSGSLWIAHEDMGVTVFRNSSTTGLESKSELEFNVYPNPVKDIMTISNSLGKNTNYTLTDERGAVVQRAELRSNKINLSNLNTGFYILTIQDGVQIMRKKIIKD